MSLSIDPREEKLTAWAREIINTLRRDLRIKTEAFDDLNGVPDDEARILVSRAGIRGDTTIKLRHGDNVRFLLGEGSFTEEIHVGIRDGLTGCSPHGDSIIVNAVGGRLVVHPSAANSVYITAPRR